MATFDITVDTSPMANSLDHVNSSVKNVTTSVIAMESAVILAQQKAASDICKNVDTGFYVLMKSQFDQKIAAVSSEMLSKMQLMETFKEDIDKIMAVMQDDFARMKLRYAKQFATIDKALENRIHELDKKAYEISRNYNLSQFKNGGELIKALCYNEDIQFLNSFMACATVKNKSSKSIDIMAADVIEQLQYSDSVQSILKDIENDERQSQYVPVIISETDSMLSVDSAIKNYISSPEAKFVNDPRYVKEIREKSEVFEWKIVSQKVYESIKNLFQNKISSEISDERVAKEMFRLFEDSKWSCIGESI